jgi:hypothetical protein
MKPTIEQRPVDSYFEEYNAVYQRMPYPGMAYISVILFLFGLIAVAWAVPFPVIPFLGKYSSYLNWASFVIAALIYFCLRLSPLISYLMLFLTLAISYLIIQLEQWQKANGPSLLAIGLIVLILGLLGQWILLKLANAGKTVRLAIISPVWALVSFLKRIKVKY